MKSTISDRNTLLGLMFKESKKKRFRNSEEWTDLFEKLVGG